MLEPPKVSIISPVFNVAPWLPACLDSIQKQSLQEWEAVFVVDGATDDSGKIIESYASQDSRIKIIYQENAGQGAARNRGAAAARGTYMFFLDPDDAIPPNALEVLYNRALDSNADIVLGDFHQFADSSPIPFENEKASPYFVQKIGTLPPIFCRDDITDYDLFYNSIFFMVVWAKIFRTDLWKAQHIEAPTGLSMGEDFMTVKKMCFVSRRITTVNDVVIYYRKRKKSATTKRSIRAFDIFKSYTYVAAMYKDMGLSSREWTYLHRAYFNWYFQHMERFTPYRLWYKFYRAMVANVRSWDTNAFDLEAIPPRDLEKIRCFRENSLVQFIKISLSRSLLVTFKLWVIAILHLAKKHLPQCVLTITSKGIDALVKKLPNGNLKVNLQKVHRHILSN